MTMQKKLKSEYSISKDIYTNMLKPMTPKKYFVNLFLKMYPYVRESNQMHSPFYESEEEINQ